MASLLWNLAGRLALISLCFLLTIASIWAETDASPAADLPQFNSNRLMKPENYREWIWLSSGLGMTYSQEGPTSDPPQFDNVFVNPSAYRAFQKTGRWPDQTVLVLEVRNSAGKQSINKGGRFQQSLAALEVHVKDARRFPGAWAFYSFSSGGTSAAPIPAGASCYSCHAQSGAVDTTFVQFYPTLAQIARQKGTFKTSPEP
jgi:Cytochrome P460